jgi:hypothetical protein
MKNEEQKPKAKEDEVVSTTSDGNPDGDHTETPKKKAPPGQG